MHSAAAGGGTITRVLALRVQRAGLVAGRWVFVAQARPPQILYDQVVS